MHLKCFYDTVLVFWHRKKHQATVMKEKVRLTEKAKRRRFQWTDESMNAAYTAVIQGIKTQRQAAKEFSVPRSTLQKLLDGKTHIGAKPGKKPLLGNEIETKLVDYAVDRAAMGVGFGKKQFFDYAAQLASKHKIKFKTGKPSEKWWRLMKKRNERMRLRKPEPTAAVRHICMDFNKVQRYFQALHDLLQKTGVSECPKRIWNMDETGLQLEHKPQRVIAQKGVRYLHARTSGNREMLTVIACVNAAGDRIPPHIIAKGKTNRVLHGFDVQSAPQGTTWSVSSSGWTKQGIARLWFEKSFLANIGDERPQVLILDGHDSHNFVELLEVAMANQIEIVELPAHTSNWLQPCDRTVFKPFKDAYNEACQDLMHTYPGTIVGHANFCGLLTKAWNKAVTADNIMSGFRACGIHPFNPAQVPQEAFIPNTLYVVVDDNSTVTDKNDVSAQASDMTKPQPLQPDFGTLTPTVQDQQADLSHTLSVAADVSLISELDTSHLLQIAEVDVANIDISYSDLDQTAVPAQRVDSSTPIASQDNNTEQHCPPELALNAVELSLREDVLDKYKSAYAHNRSMNDDPIYTTWKMYKDKCMSTLLTEGPMLGLQWNDNTASAQADTSCIRSDVSADQPAILQPVDVNGPNSDPYGDILRMPEPQVRKRNSRRSEEKFFILTSAEAYAAKLKQNEAKDKREREKQVRLEKRNNKKKDNKENAKRKSSKRNSNVLPNNDTQDTTACMYCEIQYCQSTVEWVKCKVCEQ